MKLCENLNDLTPNTENEDKNYTYQLVRRQLIIRNETLELVEEYTWRGETINANPFHEKEIRKIGI